MAMQWFHSSLRARLLAAHLLVIAVGAVILLLTTGLVAPSFFEVHMAQMIGPGGMMAQGGTQGLEAPLRDAYQASVTQSVLVATAASSLVAVLVSLFISERISNPVRRMAAASRRIAAGHYAERVPMDPVNPPDAGDELGQLASNFNDMASSLEDAERRRVELLGDVTHELRAPISTLEAHLEALLDEVMQPSPETWARLHDEAGRLRRLVDDLQELSRAEARQLSLKIEPLDPVEVAQAAVERLRLNYSEKGLELVTSIPQGLPYVLADRDRAVQVLSNLLTNALRYTAAPGQVTLSISRYAGSTRLLFQVADTGIGIAGEHLPHLFERFYRVDKSRSRAAGGSGIGLTIAKALVETMGGRIWAESPGPDQGSTFSFTFPTAPTRTV